MFSPMTLLGILEMPHIFSFYKGFVSYSANGLCPAAVSYRIQCHNYVGNDASEGPRAGTDQHSVGDPSS